MKVAIKSFTNSLNTEDSCMELIQLLEECERICSSLEDAYFGENVVDDFIKCWKGLQTAKRGANSALLKIEKQRM